MRLQAQVMDYDGKDLTLQGGEVVPHLYGHLRAAGG